MVVEKIPVLHPEVKITLTSAAARLRQELRQPLDEARRKELEGKLSFLEDARASGVLNQAAAEAIFNEMHQMRKWAELCSDTARAWPGNHRLKHCS